MGYMSKVREGIREWVDSPEGAQMMATDGFQELYTLMMEDDNFTKAVMDGAEEIDTSWGFLTEEALVQYFSELEQMAQIVGGSYRPLVEAYKEDGNKITGAMSRRDLTMLEDQFLYYNGVTGDMIASVNPIDMNGASIVSSNPSAPVCQPILGGQNITCAQTNKSLSDMGSSNSAPGSVHYAQAAEMKMGMD